MFDIEKEYIGSVSFEHRKKYGQFYTSHKIATLMVDWVMKCNPSTIYDPAFGMGAFYNIVQLQNSSVEFVGTEVDATSYNFYIKKASLINLNLINEDYFSTWGETYDAIICNPPYLKFQRFNNRHDILKKLSSMTSKNISGYTNMASAFLIKSVFELNKNGRLAYIMPIEFVNSGYGSTVKEFLTNNGNVNIIKIDDEVGVFDEVTTTVCIILFEKNDNNKTITFSKIRSIDSLNVEKCREFNSEELESSIKWLSYFDSKESSLSSTKGFVPLSMYGKFKRGIATGANEFFALNFSDVLRLGLDKKEISYCITKSNQVKTSVFDSKLLASLKKSDEAIYILNLRSSPSIMAQKYIEYGERLGYHTRYLTSKRTPWFSIEKREPAPIWFGVFSRGEFKIIRNETNALNLTCYHGFVPSKIFDTYVDKLFVYLKSRFATECINEHKRIYGKDLTKFEPGDLGEILVPSIEMFDRISDTIIEEALQSIRINGTIEESIERQLRTFWVKT